MTSWVDRLLICLFMTKVTFAQLSLFKINKSLFQELKMNKNSLINTIICFYHLAFRFYNYTSRFSDPFLKFFTITELKQAPIILEN